MEGGVSRSILYPRIMSLVVLDQFGDAALPLDLAKILPLPGTEKFGEGGGRVGEEGRGRLKRANTRPQIHRDKRPARI